MAEVITMPRLSDTMTEGKVAKWHKKVGDVVKEGDVLAEIETDKAIQDFESEFDGVLLSIGVEEGNQAEVDSVLAIIGKEGEDITHLLNSSPTEKTSADAPIQEEEVEKKTPSVSENMNTKERINISPLAKKIASEKGLDISTIKGTGDFGRIIKRDVENVTSTPKEVDIKESTTTIPNLSSETTETPNSQVRNIIAKRLSESKFTAPHYYLMVEVNMKKAIKARTQMNEISETKISFNDIIVKATALALKKHKQVNSSWAGDKIIHHGEINIGVAVAIEDGLVVPVLKNTDLMNFTQISTSVKDLASRAKTRTLKANEMEGSTFSISNLGMYGIESFTSIINQPNVAILSVGAILEKPIVKEGKIKAGHIMKLSLACDHRVVDGATGAQFLQTLKNYLENPITMLV